jgi:phosphoribosylglycinamide formyltransferase-1
MKNIVVVISGRGTNLAALLKTARDESWERQIGARVTAVISNRKEAGGLAVARSFGVPTELIEHTGFSSREAFEAALAAAIDRHRADLVLLAGFMRVLTAGFVGRYEGRLVNIHPSLLPLFPGLRTHRQALEAGVRVHGATVHFVSAAIDAGAIIAQGVIPVLPGDDEASLSRRVLAQEHRLLPRTVRAVIEGRIRWQGGRVVLNDVQPDELALLAA